MRRAWIIGASGLLGSALHRVMHSSGDHVFAPRERLAWSDEPRLLDQLTAAVQAFANVVGPDDTWEIYWAAGIGTFSSSAGELVRETVILGAFLQMLEQQATLGSVAGAIAFSSSAGALYAGANDDIINEDTMVAPTTPYAHAKLEQEALLRAFTTRHNNVFSLAARISTLYGAGQSYGKKQGLLTHIARNIVRNRPIQIYVPFDTIRDYIAVADAANRMILALRQHQGEARHVALVVASEKPTTIAEILATFKRVSRRAPRVVTSVSQNSSLYTRRVQFRSLMPSPATVVHGTSLIVGIGQLLQAERSAFTSPQGN